MTQRDAPPLPQGLEDEEEEKTTVGTAPEPLAPKPSPPRVHFGKNNTPTAFTPQAQQPPPPPQAPPSQQPQ
ncbi:MAG: hypothetical protein KIS78_36630, partial [Labilithrix sp.]|nr:hypothetical protein [Labilithrix sp.]